MYKQTDLAALDMQIWGCQQKQKPLQAVQIQTRGLQQTQVSKGQ